MRKRVYTVTVEIPDDPEETQYQVTVEWRKELVAEFKDHTVGCMNRIGNTIMADVEDAL